MPDVAKAYKYIEPATQAVFLIFCFVYLGIYAFPNIWLIDKYQLYIFTWNHFVSFLNEPAGGLIAVTGMISQIFYYPWAGIGIISALLLVVQQLIRHTSNLTGIYLPLTYLPSLILLALQFVTGNHFYFLLGIVVSLCMVRLHICYSRIKSSWCIDILLFAVFYSFSGIYALFGMALIIMLRIWNIVLGDLQSKHSWLQIALIALVGISLPWLAAYSVYNTSPVSSSFTGGFPDDFFSGSGRILKFMRYTVAAVFVCYAIIPLSRKFPFILQINSLALWNLALCVICSLLLIGYAQTQKRSLATIEMTQYLQEERWHDILLLAQKQQELNRAETVMVNLALSHTGKLSGSLLDYPQRYASQGMYLDLDASALVTFIGSEVYNRLGISNYTYRWAMEGVAMGVFSPIHLKKLLTESIVREEYALAEKYAYYFSRSLFYQNYASEVTNYLSGEKNDEWENRITQKRLHLPQKNSFTDDFFGFNYRLSRYIESNPGNKAAFDYLLAGCLLNKEIVQFARYLEIHYPPGSEMPVIYQQALAIYQVMMEGRDGFDKKYHLSPDLLRQFNTFNATFRTMLSKEQAAEQMAAKFGKTYWYYYILTDVRK